MGLKRLSSPGMIPVWLVVLAIGVILLTVEVVSRFKSDELPSPKIAPNSGETLPRGPSVHDTFSDLKDGTGSGG